MFRFLKPVMVRLKKAARSRPASPVSRRARLGVECLEDRAVPSASMLSTHAVPGTPVAPANVHIQAAPLTNQVLNLNTTSNGGGLQVIGLPHFLTTMTDMTNVTFCMQSTSNNTLHTLQIQSQTNGGVFGSSATFTGNWDGQSGPGVTVTGTLNWDAQNHIHITFSWSGHSFDGTISGSAPQYHIDGTVTVTGGGGPGHVIGNEVPNLAGIFFNLKSLDNGSTHQFQVQSQSDLPFGVATFTGVWDGQSGSGTLRYTPKGDILLTFAWGGNHTFGALVTGQAGHYHMEGIVGVTSGTGPGHVVGDQLVFFHIPIKLLLP